MKILKFLILLFVSGNCTAHVANFKVVRTNYAEQFADFDEFQFTINESTILATDTNEHTVSINSNGFDVCKAILNGDTMIFQCKLLPGITYLIKPGCCCAQFTIKPENNSSRGYVRIANSTAQDIMISVSEINTDTVSASSKSDYIFASESAMCLFKPTNITVAELKYGDPKYQFQPSSEANYDSLWIEQSKLVLGVTHFLFLHGEMITVEYFKDGQFRYTLDGYKEN